MCDNASSVIDEVWHEFSVGASNWESLTRSTWKVQLLSSYYTEGIENEVSVYRRKKSCNANSFQLFLKWVYSELTSMASLCKREEKVTSLPGSSSLSLFSTWSSVINNTVYFRKRLKWISAAALFLEWVENFSVWCVEKIWWVIRAPDPAWFFGQKRSGLSSSEKSGWVNWEELMSCLNWSVTKLLTLYKRS